MGYAAKWLGLVAVTAVMVPFIETPGFSQEAWPPLPAATSLLSPLKAADVEAPVAQAKPANDANVLLQREGVLEDGDSVLHDGSLYDAYTFEGRAGQTVAITLESLEFDTFLLLSDSEGNELASNDDIDSEAGNYHSFISLTLPADGTYQVWANGLDTTSRGGYRLTVVETTPGQAAPLLSSAAWHQVEADRLLQQGIQQYNTSQFRAALQSWEQALAIYQDIGDRRSEGNALTNLGNAYHSLGDYRQAISFHEQALAIARELEDRLGEGTDLTNLGNAYYSLGDYQQAISVYEQALAIFHELEDRLGEGAALTGLGNAYFSLGDYRQAISFHEQALAISRELENRRGEGTDLTNLGNAYFSLGDYRQAISFHEQALAIARELEDRGGEGAALTNLGNAYHSLGDYRQAISFHEQALAIARELEDRRGEGADLGNLGNAYRSLGDYRQAISFHEQALAIARELEDRRGEGTALTGLGNAYRSLDDYRQAISFHEQALAIARELEDRSGEGIVLSNLGDTLAQMEQPELAIIFLKASVEVRESIRGDIRSLDTALQQSFTDTVAGSYRFLADLLLQQNRILEAQRVLDLLKVQELDDSLRGVRSTSGTASGVALWGVETDLLALYEQVIAESTELAQLQAANYDSLSPEQQQRLATLRQRSADVQSRFIAFLDRPEVKELLASIRTETEGQNLAIETQHRALQNNLRTLPQKTALLYPLILPDRLELVLVTADGPPLRYPIAVKGDELNRAIVAFGQALKDPTSDIQPLAQQLYTWLVAPMEGQLDQLGIESLLYAPDGALRYVPLAALHDGEQYLAQRFSLSHITAASLTNFDQVPDAERRRLLAAACARCNFTITIGDTSFPFGDLPYTETEVKALAEQVPNTSVLLNQGFSRRELENRLGSYSIIHLATHGAVVENQPSQSFVVLGSGEHVTLETIRQSWSLSHAELVVLSACETAVGSAQLGSGVEILGLGYQIQEAGAQGVLASLWQVNDYGTQLLMSAFYNALAQGMTKTQALQAAQQSLMTGDFSAVGGDRASINLISSETRQPLGAEGALAHPYYWAPFILIGNGL
jgi:CHAT domain-containing protein/tetratricopeptide (TPR) repeat protein